MNDKEETQGDNSDGILEAQPLPQPQGPPPPPNGGAQAWLQVLGAHLLFFNSWGIINTFGAYQAFYEQHLLLTHSSSQISWIGTFQGFLLVFFSFIAGPIFDRGYFHALILTGTFLVVLGMMMTSLATQYWQLFLAQGVVTGLGAGCLFLPSIAIVATYFTTKRALTMGITAAGGSIGSVIYPVVFHKLQPQIGFAWATRIIGFIALATLLVSILIMKTRLPPPKKSRRMIDPAALRSLPYMVFNLGLFFAFVGLYIPFFYAIIYAERQLGIKEDLSFYMLAVLNGASVFGRILPGLLADRFGSLQVITVASLMSAIIAFCWLAVDNLGGLVVFCIFYGFISGAVVSLPPTVIAGFAPGLHVVGTWIGMSFCFSAMGLLIGNPIAGTIINVAENKFSGGIIFSASFLAAGAVAFVLAGAFKARASRAAKQ
ncbi:Aspyridones efflux protein [Lachnellula occidentalis]|uniref:Aspyridones efflux protein n=1 Tax=Lachnellula occidentalis TaxID=215460 RepID=A0A8H8UJJ0_9HELO|nr:Aspyridones efflux protein [Lachnellula occidentalis]